MNDGDKKTEYVADLKEQYIQDSIEKFRNEVSNKVTIEETSRKSGSIEVLDEKVKEVIYAIDHTDNNRKLKNEVDQMNLLENDRNELYNSIKDKALLYHIELLKEQALSDAARLNENAIDNRTQFYFSVDNNKQEISLSNTDTQNENNQSTNNKDQALKELESALTVLYNNIYETEQKKLAEKLAEEALKRQQEELAEKLKQAELQRQQEEKTKAELQKQQEELEKKRQTQTPEVKKAEEVKEAINNLQQAINNNDKDSLKNTLEGLKTMEVKDISLCSVVSSLQNELGLEEKKALGGKSDQFVVPELFKKQISSLVEIIKTGEVVKNEKTSAVEQGVAKQVSSLYEGIKLNRAVLDTKDQDTLEVLRKDLDEFNKRKAVDDVKNKSWLEQVQKKNEDKAKANAKAR